MECFLDTSALVKLFHREAGTNEVVDLVQNPHNSIRLTELARIEFISAVHRRSRQGDRAAALQGFAVISSS